MKVSNFGGIIGWGILCPVSWIARLDGSQQLSPWIQSLIFFFFFLRVTHTKSDFYHEMKI